MNIDALEKGKKKELGMCNFTLETLNLISYRKELERGCKSEQEEQSYFKTPISKGTAFLLINVWATTYLSETNLTTKNQRI